MSEAKTIQSASQLRSVIISAHEMSSGMFLQSDSEMLRRVHKLLEKAIASDSVMSGFLGRGGPCKDRDILLGGKL
jgi:hypothetical protein